MSNKTINQIKTILGMEVKMETLKLKNGTTLEAESFEIGWDLFIVSEDGEKVPTPEGSYELEDGRVIVTDAQGVIVSIGEPEAVEQPEQEEEMEQEPTQENKTPKKVVETQTTEIHFSKEDYDSIIVRLTALENLTPKTEMQEVVKEEEVKTEMSEDVIHNPEEAEKKVFNWDKRNKINSTKQRIFSKLSKLQNKN